MTTKVAKKPAKKVVKKTTKPRKIVREVDPEIRKAVQRRYGVKTPARRGGRYSTPEEIAENPAAWSGDVSDLLEDEVEVGSE